MFISFSYRARARVIPVPVESADTRVIRVLQTAAQRVTQEAESQLVSASPKNSLQALVKQKHVLDQTVDAYDRALSGHCQDEASVLAAAAQDVVVQAAQKVYVDRGGSVPLQGEAAIQSVTVGELTEVTQDAIARAVQRNGTASTEVDIVRTAAGIIKLESDAVQAIPLQIRSVTTGALQTRINPPLINSYLSPLPEYSWSPPTNIWSSIGACKHSDPFLVLCDFFFHFWAYRDPELYAPLTLLVIHGTIALWYVILCIFLWS